jgi:type IV secretory pathway VirB4 component
MTPQPRPDRDRAGRETRHVGILGTPADVRRARAAARRDDTTTAQAQRRWENRASLPEPAQPPASGRPGADALRCWLPLRLPAHRASSATLAGAYPFLAGPRVPTDGVYVGQDAFSGGPFCFDPWTWYARGALTNPNVVLAGVIGQGKSALAKSLAVRSLPLGRRIYVPGDPKGEWAPVARRVGGTVIDLGGALATRLNPLDPGTRPSGVTAAAWATVVAARRRQLLASLLATVLGRSLHPAEHTVLDVALTQAQQASGRPGGSGTSGPVLTLTDVEAALSAPSRDAARDAAMSADVLAAEARDTAHALRRLVRGDLAGLFDGPSTVTVDPYSPMVVLDLSRLGTDDDLLALAMTCASAWLEGAVAGATGPRWIVYDEAWRLMRSLPLIRRMQAQWKLSRAQGIANLMIIHRLSDLDAVGDARSESRAVAAGLLADCSTRIVYRQETDQLAATARALGLTDTERDLLPHLPRGSGLWKIPGQSHVVHHRLHAEEAVVYDTDSAMTEPAIRTGPDPLIRLDRT